MKSLTFREKLLGDLEKTINSRDIPQWLMKLKEKAVKEIGTAETIETRQIKEGKLLEKWGDIAYSVDVSGDIREDLDISTGEEIAIIVVNGRISKILDPKGEVAAKNISIKDILEVGDEEKKIVVDQIESILSHKPNVFDALNIATFKRGYFIGIPNKTILETPIKIVKVFTDITPATVSFNIIKVGKESKVSIYEETITRHISKKAKNLTLENIFVEENARLDYSVSYVPNDALEAIIHRRLNIFSNAQLESSYAWLGGKLTLSKIDNNLVGPGADANHVEIVFGSGEETFYLLSKLNHFERYTKGVILNRGVLKERSRMVYNGLINIEEKASGADSFLESHVILLDKTAEAYDVPGLEIKTNDVRATHSASVSPVDEDHIFYMRTRGIDRETAKKMIVFGTLEPAIEKISLEDVKKHILERIEEKWGSAPN